VVSKAVAFFFIQRVSAFSKVAIGPMRSSAVHDVCVGTSHSAAMSSFLWSVGRACRPRLQLALWWEVRDIDDDHDFALAFLKGAINGPFSLSMETQRTVIRRRGRVPQPTTLSLPALTSSGCS
jgi:hypothetical protein